MYFKVFPPTVAVIGFDPASYSVLEGETETLLISVLNGVTIDPSVVKEVTITCTQSDVLSAALREEDKLVFSCIGSVVGGELRCTDQLMII